MRISKWLLVVALALPISTFAITPTDNAISEVGTVVAVKYSTIESICTKADKCTTSLTVTCTTCTTSLTVTKVVTTLGMYAVKGKMNAPIGATATRKKGYLLCVAKTCHPITIGITFKE